MQESTRQVVEDLIARLERDEEVSGQELRDLNRRLREEFPDETPTDPEYWRANTLVC